MKLARVQTRLAKSAAMIGLSALAAGVMAQTAPAPQPAWKQGMPANMSDSKLAPLAGRMTVTPAAEIPVQNIKLPPGFKAEVWATGMPGARAMALGDNGKIYIGTRAIGRVYEVNRYR